MIYLDNAATTYPKPEAVYAAVTGAMRDAGGNPGRSGHRLSLAAGKVLDEARFLMATLLNVPKPEHIVFTLNATDALNLAVRGIVHPGDHVITGSMEHNSVIRPLEAMRQYGVEYTKIPASPLTGAAIRDIEAAIRQNTKLMIFSHVSNVTGTMNPIAAIGSLCRARGISLLVDAAQSAGILPLNVQDMKIDLLAFPGHKGLLGPQGTGGLYISAGIEVQPLRYGGTGSHSESAIQPMNSPDRFESGTANTPGLAGLAAGVRYILRESVEAIQEKEAFLANRLIDGLSGVRGITLFGPPAGKKRSGVVSLRIDGIDPAETALILDNSFDIAVRAGLHCAPDAHQVLGTLKSGGTVRISAGSYNTADDIDACIKALAEIAGEGLREA